MRRVLMICLFAAVAVGPRARAEEDPRDVERQFRFLLSREDELHAQYDQFDSHTPKADLDRWNSQIRRLEGDYQHFLNNHPQHARAMVAYGELLDDQGQMEDAERWWKRAIAADPNEAYAYNDLANHYGHNGHADQALRYYQTAIRLVPTEPVFRFNWATTCSLFWNESRAVYGWDKNQIFQHALEQLRSARDLAPQNFDYSSAYAETFFQTPTTNWPEAYQAWQFCLHQPLGEGNQQFVYANLARVCIRMGQFDEARQWASHLSRGEQESARRAIERRIAESTKAADASATNSASPAPGPVPKP